MKYVLYEIYMKYVSLRYIFIDDNSDIHTCDFKRNIEIQRNIEGIKGI